MKKTALLYFMMLLVLFSCLSISNGKSENKERHDTNNRIIEVQELGGCYCKEGFDLIHFNVIPTIDVAFDVALPILKSVYHKDFEKNLPFKGYLKNDSIWVVYGSTPQLVEGGFPYIEISKHDGRILKITHTK